jgi:RsiW-degrading membrane proteinase PrsW (M82 family)
MLFKFTLVAINLGTTGLTLYEWRKMNAAMRVFAIVIVVMTFVASIPPFIEGLEFIIARSWPIVSFFLNIRILILLLAIVAFSIFIGFILIDEWEPAQSNGALFVRSCFQHHWP